MSEKINLSINGQCQVPPGFRFHPTEEELLNYYLRKKVAYEKIDLDVIREVDLNKLEPWDIQEWCKIGSTPQNDWYFFSHKDKKYPTGTRTNRATAAGFWKATGRDKIIYSSCKRIGLRKTLVFYKGRAPHGLKSDWIMHEYRLDDNHETNASIIEGDNVPEDGWVVCRVFKKKNYLKALEIPNGMSSLTNYPKSPICTSSGNDGMLDQILLYMGRSSKTENKALGNISDTSNYDDMMKFGATNNSSVASYVGMQEKFMHLPGLESPSLPSFPLNNSQCDQDNHGNSKACYQSIQETFNEAEPFTSNSTKASWVALDRLVASQLNGQVDTSEQLSCFRDQISTAFGSCASGDDDAQLSQFYQGRPDQALQDFKGGNDTWNFRDSSPPSSIDPLCHLSV